MNKIQITREIADGSNRSY